MTGKPENKWQYDIKRISTAKSNSFTLFACLSPCRYIFIKHHRSPEKPKHISSYFFPIVSSKLPHIPANLVQCKGTSLLSFNKTILILTFVYMSLETDKKLGMSDRTWYYEFWWMTLVILITWLTDALLRCLSIVNLVYLVVINFDTREKCSKIMFSSLPCTCLLFKVAFWTLLPCHCHTQRVFIFKVVLSLKLEWKVCYATSVDANHKPCMYAIICYKLLQLLLIFILCSVDNSNFSLNKKGKSSKYCVLLLCVPSSNLSSCCCDLTTVILTLFYLRVENLVEDTITPFFVIKYYVRVYDMTDTYTQDLSFYVSYVSVPEAFNMDFNSTENYAHKFEIVSVLDWTKVCFVPGAGNHYKIYNSTIQKTYTFFVYLFCSESNHR